MKATHTRDCSALKGADVADADGGRAGAHVAQVVGAEADGAGALVPLVTTRSGAGEELADQSRLHVGLLVTGTLCHSSMGPGDTLVWRNTFSVTVQRDMVTYHCVKEHLLCHSSTGPGDRP